MAEQLKNADIVYDMYATNNNEGCNMNINLEKHTALQIKNMNLKKVIEDQFEGIKSSYKNMGYTNVNVAYEKIEVDGKKYDGLKLSDKIQDYDFNAVVFTFKKDKYLANITVAGLGDNKIDNLLSYFEID